MKLYPRLCLVIFKNPVLYMQLKKRFKCIMCWKKEYILFPLPQIAISNYYVEKLKFFIHMLLFAEILEYGILAINEFPSKCSFVFYANTKCAFCSWNSFLRVCSAKRLPDTLWRNWAGVTYFITCLSIGREVCSKLHKDYKRYVLKYLRFYLIFN